MGGLGTTTQQDLIHPEEHIEEVYFNFVCSKLVLSKLGFQCVLLMEGIQLFKAIY